MEKFFKLRENGTNVRTEVMAGISTFMTMAYIVALNPNLLTNFDTGSPTGAAAGRPQKGQCGDLTMDYFR